MMRPGFQGGIKLQWPRNRNLESRVGGTPLNGYLLFFSLAMGFCKV
jgi:hypothetical protein